MCNRQKLVVGGHSQRAEPLNRVQKIHDADHKCEYTFKQARKGLLNGRGISTGQYAKGHKGTMWEAFPHGTGGHCENRLRQWAFPKGRCGKKDCVRAKVDDMVGHSMWEGIACEGIPRTNQALRHC